MRKNILLRRYIILGIVCWKRSITAIGGWEDRKCVRKSAYFYEKKYAEYYLRVIYAQKVTYSATLFVLAFILYGLTNRDHYFFLLLLFAGLAFYYYGNQINDRIQKRSQEMISDFSEVVSKLALLTNAGMIMRMRGNMWQIQIIQPFIRR